MTALSRESRWSILGAVVVSAPRLAPELLAALAELDDPAVPVAEINRRLGAIAAAAGWKRPSYEQVRVRLNELRSERELRREARDELLGEIADIFLRPRGPERVHDEIFRRRSEISSRRRRDS